MTSVSKYTRSRLPAPWIAPWSEEKPLAAPLIVRGSRQGPRVAYADEAPGDRDSFGALWYRKQYLPGRGRPQFDGVHSLRQRQAVFRDLCQVGGAPIGQINSGRRLYLMKDVSRGVADGEVTPTPPICVPCALFAIEFCPHLREYIAAWCESTPSWGVLGTLYDQRTLLPVDTKLVSVPYGDPRMNWIVGARLLVELVEPAVADLQALAPGESMCPPLPLPSSLREA
jgi:hypothetical protein